LAWVKLVIAIFFLTVGTATIVKFYQCRYILDIRTSRSVHLVVLTGIVLNLTFLVAMNTSCRILWGKSLRWFWSSLVLFFVLPVYSGCYISRSIRLAVVFHPRAKHALRWLIPERNHIIILLLLGVCFTAIPIYHELTQEVWEIIPLQLDLLENTSLGLAVVLAALYPLIRWNVDDMFNIGKELMFVMASLCMFWETRLRYLAHDFGWRLGAMYKARKAMAAQDFTSTLATLLTSCSTWHGKLEKAPELGAKKTLSQTKNEHGSISELGFTSYGGLVTINGKKRFATSPFTALPRSDHELLCFPCHRYSNSHSTTSIGSTPGDMVAVMEVKTQEEADTWNFERLASTPMLASAFEDFARKALCHESVMFLEHASRYRGGDYSFANTRGVWALEYEGFRAIVNTYVCPGSPEEINIRHVMH
ncbi:unnamed protein product, partial [Discosporangium mesarthrocarpum]